MTEPDSMQQKREWKEIMRPVEDRTKQELKSKNIRSGQDKLAWLERSLPNLEDVSMLGFSSSEFDPEVQHALSLSNNEYIFLIIPAAINFPQGEIGPHTLSNPLGLGSGGLILFTTEKAIATSLSWQIALTYWMALKSAQNSDAKTRFDEQVKRILAKILNDESKSIKHTYPLAYDTIYDISVLDVGNLDGTGEIAFRRTDRSPSFLYEVKIGRPEVPEKAWISVGFLRKRIHIVWKPYPVKKEVEKQLLKIKHARMDNSGRTLLSSCVHVKMFIDALRRIPSEKQKSEKLCEQEQT